MPDGSMWDVPISVIAKNRAEYYATKEPPYEETYKIELKYALENEEEIIDWAQNNMDWDDVKNFARLFKISVLTPEDFDEGWANGEHDIVETK